MTIVSLVNVLIGVAATGGTMLRIVRYPEYADYAARTKRLLSFIF